ncbi:MAG TPA: hypothetical protein VFA98_16630 [Thermoanaerobaculia bacterium]|nr:hypothetical protein [Thermoanaerobaculia bacterium]
MRTKQVHYRCDQCGNKASERTIHREGQWREIRFGHIDDEESDVRQVCSFECARLLLADIIKNLCDNDEGLEDRKSVEEKIINALKRGSKPWQNRCEEDE